MAGSTRPLSEVQGQSPGDWVLGGLGELSGVNDADRGVTQLGEGDILGGAFSLAMAWPGAKAFKLGKEGIEEVGERATKPGRPPTRPVTGGNRRIHALRSIGQQGAGRSIREVPGGLERAKEVYSGLARGAQPYRTLPDGRQLLQRTDGTIIGFRSRSASGPPSIDVRPPGSKDLYFQLKFTGGR
jgi:hypothetical protein